MNELVGDLSTSPELDKKFEMFCQFQWTSS